MYPDIGLGDWRFEIESASGEAIAATVLDIALNREKGEGASWPKRCGSRAPSRGKRSKACAHRYWLEGGYGGALPRPAVQGASKRLKFDRPW